MAKYEVRLLIDTEEGNPDKWDWNALTGENVVDWHTTPVADSSDEVTRPDKGDPIGAYSTIKWDSDRVEEVYVSFGSYDEDNDCDTYGINDEFIFRYETEFQWYVGVSVSDGVSEFTILSCVYRYFGEA